MTPEEFKKTIEELLRLYQGDSEASHVRTDEVMEGLLITLGYGEGVRLIQDSARWYA